MQTPSRLFILLAVTATVATASLAPPKQVDDDVSGTTTCTSTTTMTVTITTCPPSRPDCAAKTGAVVIETPSPAPVAVADEVPAVDIPKPNCTEQATPPVAPPPPPSPPAQQVPPSPPSPPSPSAPLVIPSQAQPPPQPPVIQTRPSVDITRPTLTRPGPPAAATSRAQFTGNAQGIFVETGLLVAALILAVAAAN